MKSTRFWNVAVGLVLLSVLRPTAAASQSVEWIRQLGTSTDDQSRGVSADGSGNVYIAGYTEGSLDGPSHGDSDAFISKYSAAGVLEWTRQLGTDADDFAYGGVSFDGLGNAYISGATYGSLGGPNQGNADAFVSKYNAAGVLEWTRQLGSSALDYGLGVSADGLGNVFISGYTNGSLSGPSHGSSDVFVSKYNAMGGLEWTRQLGTSSIDQASDVSADGLGNVYVSGFTRGSLGGPNQGIADAFVSKYNSTGVLEWTRQLGTSTFDSGLGVSADGLGNVYISGQTTGSLDGPNQGGPDAYLSKYNSTGVLEWTRQLGTSSFDYGHGVAADRWGRVYLTGHTFGSFDGPSHGNDDVFLSEFSATGVFRWTRQLGTSSGEESYHVSAAERGSVYISGFSLGSFGGPNQGYYDAFLARINVVPEPSCQVLFFGGLILAHCLHRQRRAQET